ncbi:MAG TPA: hypothetical protein PLT78_14745 [Ignavibacteriaceae bacterium]|nr:hypothetical protein [Ignavibacteriaceae bacterium]
MKIKLTSKPVYNYRIDFLNQNYSINPVVSFSSIKHLQILKSNK